MSNAIGSEAISAFASSESVKYRRSGIVGVDLTAPPARAVRNVPYVAYP
jgi:hypothetical protein